MMKFSEGIQIIYRSKGEIASNISLEQGVTLI